jgi:hypothetical protein
MIKITFHVLRLIREIRGEKKVNHELDELNEEHSSQTQ